MKACCSLAIILFTLLIQPSSAHAASDGLVALGERLFNETRFARYFWLKSQGDANFQLTQGESHLETLNTPEGEIPSPFAGESTSCASCHLVDQAFDIQGMRTYTDFSDRSRFAPRSDLKTKTERNSPSLVGIGSPFSRNRFSHHDGEFQDHAQTAMANFTGRNFGWSQEERPQAKRHIIHVIKNDNGQGDLAQEFGGSYKRIWASVDPTIDEEFVLAADERLDIDKASEQQIFKAITRAVNAYLNDLDFETNEQGEYSGSAFDQFLLKNGFTTTPHKNESNQAYTLRLREFLKALKNPQFIEPVYLESHKKSVGLGKLEWEGAKIFFNLPNKKNLAGNCFSCHSAPLYTDQSFHNVGATQIEYDHVHGYKSFSNLEIPNSKNRGQLYLNQRPLRHDPKKVDLGVWNFYQRQKPITDFLQQEFCLDKQECSLERMIARFKTPSLRNLGHSAPYFHHGKMPSLEHVLTHYMQASALKKHGQLRNGAKELQKMKLHPQAIRPLSGFLQALNEHYD